MSEKLENPVISDRTLVEFIRRVGDSSIQEMVDFTGVTATAIRQRLSRLMDQGLVVRQSEAVGRGRPTHRYSLSSAGVRSAGDNYRDLASVLWAELRAIDNPDVKHRLLRRVVERMGQLYREQIGGDSIAERFTSLKRLMQDQDIAFEVEQSSGPERLPILKAYACPYPDLAEQDRSICSMEKMLFSELLGESVRLDCCRLDGAVSCNFVTSSAPIANS